MFYSLLENAQKEEKKDNKIRSQCVHGSCSFRGCPFSIISKLLDLNNRRVCNIFLSHLKCAIRLKRDRVIADFNEEKYNG